MGIFSEIAERAEEEAYTKGFWTGVFWPITLPYLAVQGAIFRVREKLQFRKWQKVAKGYEREAQQILGEEESMPPQGNTRWYNDHLV